MKNLNSSVYKVSELSRKTNTQILVIFGFQILLALIGAVLGTIWAQKLDKQDSVNPYMDFPDEQKSMLVTIIQMTGTWILIFTNLVPISLLVTLEMVRFWQGMFMEYDIMMYDQDQFLEMKAQTTNINEELGQVEYIFSDKTGTLTCNIMEFKKFSAGTTSYGRSEKPIEQIEVSNVSFVDPHVEEVLQNEESEECQKLVKVLEHLSLCHSIIIDARTGDYNASSPDELALVNAAKYFEVEYQSQDVDGNITIDFRGQEMKYELLAICEFNSDRKRMSVIVRNSSTKEIHLFCKGADSVIEKLLSKESKNSEVYKQTMKFVDGYATEGLRTLLLTSKKIDLNTFD